MVTITRDSDPPLILGPSRVSGPIAVFPLVRLVPRSLSATDNSEQTLTSPAFQEEQKTPNDFPFNLRLLTQEDGRARRPQRPVP